MKRHALTVFCLCLCACSARTPDQSGFTPGAPVGFAGISAPPPLPVAGVSTALATAGTLGSAGAAASGGIAGVTAPPPPPPPTSVAGTTGGSLGSAGSSAAAGSIASAGSAGVAGSMARAGAPAAAGSGGSGAPATPGTIKFSPNVLVSTDGKGQQTEVTMAAHASAIVVGYIDNRNQGAARCTYTVSTDGGMTWGKSQVAVPQLTGGRGFTGDPSVAIDDSGNIYLVAEDYSGQTPHILMATSTDSGATFSPWRPVNTSIDKPWVGAARDGTVYLSWLGFPGGFKRSTDHGMTWSTAVSLGNLSAGTGISGGDTGLVHVAYNQGTSVRYVRSSDWGATADTGRNLTQWGKTCSEPCSPRSMAIVSNASDPTGKIVAIAWAATLTGGDGNDDVWVIVSRDGGETFSKPIRANDNTTPSRQFQPWVGVDRRGRVHVAWTDFRNDNKNAVYYARMSDMDKGFEPNVEVTDQRGAPGSFLGDYKGLAIQGNDVLVTWQDTRRDTGDIYFARAVGAAAD